MDSIKLEKETVNHKTVLLGIGNILVYLFISMAFSLFEFNDIRITYAFDVLSYIIITTLSILFFRKRLKRDITHIKENRSKYMSEIVKNQLIMFILFMVASFISVFLLKSDEQSVNQQAIESLPTLMIFISAVLYSPLVEELVFRGSFRRFIKNDILFIIISGFVFGMLHTAMEASFIEAIIKGIPYITLGVYFAYLYVKTENICISMICHFVHNFLAVMLIFFFK